METSIWTQVWNPGTSIPCCKCKSNSIRYQGYCQNQFRITSKVQGFGNFKGSDIVSWGPCPTCLHPHGYQNNVDFNFLQRNHVFFSPRNQIDQHLPRMICCSFSSSCLKIRMFLKKAQKIAGENNVFGCLPATTIEAGGVIHSLSGDCSLWDPAWAKYSESIFQVRVAEKYFGNQMGEQLEREFVKHGWGWSGLQVYWPGRWATGWLMVFRHITRRSLS